MYTMVSKHLSSISTIVRVYIFLGMYLQMFCTMYTDQMLDVGVGNPHLLILQHSNVVSQEKTLYPQVLASPCCEGWERVRCYRLIKTLVERAECHVDGGLLRWVAVIGQQYGSRMK